MRQSMSDRVLLALARAVSTRSICRASAGLVERVAFDEPGQLRLEAIELVVLLAQLRPHVLKNLVDAGRLIGRQAQFLHDLFRPPPEGRMAWRRAPKPSR